MTCRTRLFALIGLSVVVVAPPVAAQVADHLQCFSVKDVNNPAVSAYLVALSATKEPQLPFQSTPECRVKSRPELFCLHVEKTAVDPPPPGGVEPLPSDVPSFACFRVKGRCDPAQTAFKLNERDQLHAGLLTIGSVRYICAPAVVGTCGQTANQCNGDCPANQVCSSVFLGGCQCVMAPPPACNASTDFQMCSSASGACPAGFFCKAAFGGCACFHTCASSFPQCDAEDECGTNSHCGNIGNTCACIPDADCGETAPACNGPCPPSQPSCVAGGPSGCQCQ